MLKRLRPEPGFYKRLCLLALPMVIQNLITTSLGFVDTFMVGLVGSNELSAVTAANTPIFLLQCAIFGMMSGLSVLVTQYWGQQDMRAINKCLGVVLYIALGVSSLAAGLLFFFPTQIMSFVTNNPLLIELGAPYLQLVGLGYVFNSVSSVYVSLQRSTENPAFGMILFGTSMLVNTFLNYMFIFGKLGAPKLGVTGAALATMLARVLELVIVVFYAARNRRTPLIPDALLRPGKEFFRKTIQYSAPVIFNETVWSAGVSTVTVIMGHMAISADMLAAHASMGNIDKIATVSCFGVANAGAVMVGKRIGERASRDNVYHLGVSVSIAALLCGAIVSAILAILLPTVFIPYLYPLFKLSPLATQIATTLCIVYIFLLPLRSYDATVIVGVLRAGGDSLAAALLDIVPIWLISLPVMALLALVLDAPITLVCIAAQSENLIKWPLSTTRLRSRKWINDVTVS